MRARRVLTAGLALVVLVAACGSDDDQGGPPITTSASGGALDGAVTVLAAASLTDAFAEIELAFEEAHAGVDVVVSVDGSAKLATAIVEGAPADVFASADASTLERVADAGATTGTESTFATNVLQIVVPQGNPLNIRSLRDLTGPDVTLALCGAEVPCGAYARQAFARAGLTPPAAGDQESVTGVLTQVQLGEADAGIVYVTDVLAAGTVDGIDLAPDQEVVASYRASPLVEASSPAAAEAFVRFLTQDGAQVILRAFGFGPP